MNRIANPHTQRSRIANAAELGDLEIPMIPMGNFEHIAIRPPVTDELIKCHNHCDTVANIHQL